jgi:hypothetical protein
VPTATVPQSLDGAAAAVAVVIEAFADFPILLVDGMADVDVTGCPLGGSATRFCNQLGVPRVVTAVFDDCAIPAPSGSIVLDGSATLTALTGTCPNVLLPPIDEDVNLQLQYLDAEGAMQRAVSAQLTADVLDLRGLDSPCFYSGITATVSGLIQTQVAGGAGVDVMLNDTEIAADISSHSTDCLALESTQVFDGTVTFTDFPPMRTYPIDFQTLELMRVASLFAEELEIDGDAAGPCFGGGATLSTVAALQLPLSDVCPVGGTVLIDTSFAPPHTLFYGEGGVEVDEDNDGDVDESYLSCSMAPGCG